MTHNSGEMKARVLRKPGTEVPVAKRSVVHPHTGVVFGPEKEGNDDTLQCG